MELMIKIAAVCVPAALLAGLLRKDSPVMSLLIAIAAGCAAVYAALGAAGEILDFLRDAADMGGVSGVVLGVLVRTLGISIAARLASDLCRDAGLGSAASAAEFAGSAAALYTALPLLRGMLSLIEGLL